MQEGFEFIKQMWAGIGVPGMVVPTVSVEELNKKITDLKAVESWLMLNLTMLRSTIQALEVQSATLAALQAMGTTSPVNAQDQAEVDLSATPLQNKERLNATFVENANAWWEVLQSQFNQIVHNVASINKEHGSTPSDTSDPESVVKKTVKAKGVKSGVRANKSKVSK